MHWETEAHPCAPCLQRPRSRYFGSAPQILPGLLSPGAGGRSERNTRGRANELTLGTPSCTINIKLLSGLDHLVYSKLGQCTPGHQARAIEPRNGIGLELSSCIVPYRQENLWCSPCRAREGSSRRTQPGDRSVLWRQRRLCPPGL